MQNPSRLHEEPPVRRINWDAEPDTSLAKRFHSAILRLTAIRLPVALEPVRRWAERAIHPRSPRITKIRDTTAIVLGAAVCAFSVLLITVALVVPILCPDGGNRDACMRSPAGHTLPGDAQSVMTAVIPASSTQPVRSFEPAERREPVLAAVNTAPAYADASSISERVLGPAKPEIRTVKTIKIGPNAAAATMLQPDPSPSAPTVEEEETTKFVPFPVPADQRPPEMVRTAKAEPAANSGSSKTVARSGVTVRSGPGRGNQMLFNLSAGTKVSVLDTSKGWLKVQDPKGRVGWAYSRYLR